MRCPKSHPLHQQNQPGLPDFSHARLCTRLLEDTGCQYGQDSPNRTVELKVANYVCMSSLATWKILCIIQSNMIVYMTTCI